MQRQTSKKSWILALNAVFLKITLLHWLIWISIFFSSAPDIDQLTRIMLLVGKPDEKLMTKLGSEEVEESSWCCFTFPPPPHMAWVCSCVFVCGFFWLTRLFSVWCADIDQLTRILLLCGTPEEDTLSKITSEEVIFGINWVHICRSTCYTKTG